MSVYSNQDQEIQQEEDLLLLHQTTTTTATATPLDSSSDDPATANCLSLLNLHNFPPSSSAVATSNHPPCINCGFHPVSPASHKRSSPDQSTASARDREQPRQKKPNNHPSLHGFSKIPLPTQDQPLLRRCSSDTHNPPAVVTTDTSSQVLVDPKSPAQNAEMTCPESPLSAARTSTAKLPPRAPPLRRSVSDPNPSPSKTFSSSCGVVGGYESPNDKQRMKRMRDCIRELNKWWDEMLPEKEENAEINNNNATMGNSDADMEESVSVERAGECLIIHFKCPCRKGYQILISGRNCYYKLM